MPNNSVYIGGSCVDLLEVFNCAMPSVNLVFCVPDTKNIVRDIKFVYLGPINFSPLTAPFSFTLLLRPDITACFFMNTSTAGGCVRNLTLHVPENAYVCEASIISLQYTSVEHLIFDWEDHTITRLPLALTSVQSIQYVEVISHEDGGLKCDCKLAVNFYKYFSNRTLKAQCRDNPDINASSYIANNWLACVQNASANDTSYDGSDPLPCQQQCLYSEEKPSKRNCTEFQPSIPLETTQVTIVSDHRSSSYAIANHTTTSENLSERHNVHVAIIVSLVIVIAILVAISVFAYCTWQRSREGENLLHFWRIWSRTRAVSPRPVPPLLMDADKSHATSGSQSTD